MVYLLIVTDEGYTRNVVIANSKEEIMAMVQDDSSGHVIYNPEEDEEDALALDVLRAVPDTPGAHVLKNGGYFVYPFTVLYIGDPPFMYDDAPFWSKDS